MDEQTTIEDRGDEVEVIEQPVDQDALKALADEQVDDEAAEKQAEKPEDDNEDKPHGIPKARFNEVNEAKKEALRKLEEAQAEIERLRQASAPPKPQVPAFSEDDAEQAYLDALLEGDTTKALQIRKEINAYIRHQAAQEVETTLTAKQQQQLLKEAGEQAVKDYPYLDTPAGADALEAIIAMRDAAIARGVAPHKALTAAVAKIAPRFDSTPAEVSEKKSDVDNREKEAVRRGAVDAQAQPPSIQAGIGNRATSGRIDVAKLDDDQFANLSEAEKKRLRGD